VPCGSRSGWHDRGNLTPAACRSSRLARRWSRSLDKAVPHSQLRAKILRARRFGFDLLSKIGDMDVQGVHVRLVDAPPNVLLQPLASYDAAGIHDHKPKDL